MSKRASILAFALVLANTAHAQDGVVLGTRMTARALPIGTLEQGQSVRFRVDGRRGWFVRLSSQPLLTPTYADDRVYLGAGFSSNVFFALDAVSGSVEWRASAPDGGPTAAIVEDGKVLFNTESCTLFAVDARTGEQRWRRWLGDPLMGQAAAANGLVFSGHIRTGNSPGNSGQYGFTALDIDDGEVRWTFPITADVMNAPVLHGDGAYFTTMDGNVWHADQQTGRLHWRVDLRATSAPWVEGELVYLTRRSDHNGERGEQTVVLHRNDGRVVHTYDRVGAAFLPERADSGGIPAGWAYEGSRPTIVDGRLYQTIGNEVHCRDARDGRLLWRRRYSGSIAARPASPPAIAGAQLVFGTSDGVIYALDVDTGLTAWAYRVGEPIVAQPTVAEGWIYAATTNGGVVGIEAADATFDGWHMWGGNARHDGAMPAINLASARTSENADGPTEGSLRLATPPEDGELAGFPLRGTRVDARVSGMIARVTVEQTFENPYDHPVEAIYLFPLPDDAAVDEMELSAGESVVRGRIQRRSEARRIYVQARARGALASLLEEERPNLFRQSLANILPGAEVRVTLRYTQVLPYEEGSYAFVFPMVAGPRYTPQGASDAREASQPILTDSSRRPDRVEVSIAADLGTPVRAVTSPSHGIEVARRGSHARVTLSDRSVRPDRDLIVRFRVADAAPEIAALATPPEGDRSGYVTLAIHPRLEVGDAQVAPRELVFLVDTSSSMRGRPFALAQAALVRAIDGARADDTIRVIAFSDLVRELDGAALPATDRNKERARAFVRSMRPFGATEMVAGVRAALDRPADRERMRIAVLFTDGYIGNEEDVFRAVNGSLGEARVFPFGVGSAVNRYLLTRLAQIGRGDASIVTPTESPERAADLLHERIARPYLTDVSIDWGGLQVSDVYPERLPDVFADRPVVLHARFTRAGRARITVRGRLRGTAFSEELPLELPSEGTARPELGSVWARARIDDRMLAMALRPNPAFEEEVTTLALEHGIVTRWTSFVAVIEQEATEVAPQPVNQAVDAPSGMAMMQAGNVAVGEEAEQVVYNGGGGVDVQLAAADVAVESMSVAGCSRCDASNGADGRTSVAISFVLILAVVMRRRLRRSMRA